MENKVLLTGGSGFIGGRISRMMNREGFNILHLSRNPSVGQTTACGWVRGDIRDPEACICATSDVEIVVHAAGEKNDPSQMHAINVEGTANLVDAARKNRVKLFIYLSSVGVIGAPPLQKITWDEKAVCRPGNEYERSKRLAEDIVRKASVKGLRSVILRPTNVFGDQDPARGLLSLTKTVRDGRFVFLGGRDVMCNFVFVEDVAHAVVTMIRNKETLEDLYHIADPCTLGDFIDAVADELSVPRPKRTIPYTCAGSIRMILRMFYWSHFLEGSAIYARLVSLNNQAMFVSERLYRDRRFRQPVGWRIGIKHLIHWYRDQKEL